MPEPGRDAKPLFKKKPTVALFPLDKQSDEVLRGCFSQFSIDVVAAVDTGILRQEKLEGCVVSLTAPNAEDVVAQARNSAWQKRMVIYGLGPSSSLRRLTKFGINVLLDSPVARPAAIKAIHATRLLLLNELRRYVRLPLVTPVTVLCGTQRIATTSEEISAGGMSLKAAKPYPPRDSSVLATFALPGSEPLNMAGVVCWTDEKSGYFGLRFQPAGEARQAVKGWIEEYLGMD